MSVQQRMHEKLIAAFEPLHLDIRNDSHGHNVPAGSESHFRVIVVSPAFDGLGRLARHRAVHAALADELAGPIHALQIEALSPSQWSGESSLEPPECRGGAKRESRSM